MKFLLLLLLAGIPLAHADQEVFTVAPMIQELSAGVWDFQADRIWTLGDNDPVLGLTDPLTWKTTVVQVEGARNDDWEAMVQDERRHLWVLASGDNRHDHAFRSAFEIDPDSRADGKITPMRRIDFTYPVGKLNVEAAVVRGEDLYLFEKSYVGRSRIFSISISKDAPALQVATQHGTIPPVGPITDAALSADGTLYLLTYLSILSCRDCLDRSVLFPKVRKLSFWGQAETIFLTPSGALMVGAESGKVYRID